MQNSGATTGAAGAAGVVGEPAAKAETDCASPPTACGCKIVGSAAARPVAALDAAMFFGCT